MALVVVNQVFERVASVRGIFSTGRVTLTHNSVSGVNPHDGVVPHGAQPMVPWYSVVTTMSLFELLIALKVFLGRFDMRMMQVGGWVGGWAGRLESVRRSSYALMLRLHSTNQVVVCYVSWLLLRLRSRAASTRCMQPSRQAIRGASPGSMTSPIVTPLCLTLWQTVVTGRCAHGRSWAVLIPTPACTAFIRATRSRACWHSPSCVSRIKLA